MPGPLYGGEENLEKSALPSTLWVLRGLGGKSLTRWARSLALVLWPWDWSHDTARAALELWAALLPVFCTAGGTSTRHTSAFQCSARRKPYEQADVWNNILTAMTIDMRGDGHIYSFDDRVRTLSQCHISSTKATIPKPPHRAPPLGTNTQMSEPTRPPHSGQRTSVCRSFPWPLRSHGLSVLEHRKAHYIL